MKNSNLNNEAPILTKVQELYREYYQCFKLFPKKDQYTLGKRCEDYILAFMEHIVAASEESLPERKLKILQVSSAKLDVLKILLRTARELKMIDTKKYLGLEERIQEVGRMLGGWIRSLNIKTL